MERIRRRVIGMLVASRLPHEFRDYAKLLKGIGVGENWAEIQGQIDQANPHVMRFYNYLNERAERRVS